MRYYNLVGPVPNVEVKPVEVPVAEQQENPNSFWGLAGAFVKGYNSSSTSTKTSEASAVDLKKLMAQSEEDSKGQVLMMQLFGLLAVSVVILIAFKFVKK